MNFWTFHANNKVPFNTLKEIAEFPDILWEVAVKHRHEVALYDKCILWLSGIKAGIYAFGTILTLPEMMGEEENRLRDLCIPEVEWPKYQQQRLRVKILIDQKITDHPILRNDLPWEKINVSEGKDTLDYFFRNGLGQTMIKIPDGLFDVFKNLVKENNTIVANDDEIESIEEIENAVVDNEIPIDRRCPEQIISTSRIYPRIKANSKIALTNSGFRCELEDIVNAHNSFTSRITRENFVEAHHLVPMNAQYIYAPAGISLDVPENIVALCPNCHKMIHLAENVVKSEKIIKLFERRQSRLNASGIDITLNELLNLYFKTDIEDDENPKLA
jgi:hypothetical protein